MAIRAAAPGRVNLIGEHTDYNGGFVLPTAIPQQTRVELTPRTDAVVHASSADVVGEDRQDARSGEYVLGQERQRGDWLDYVQGLTWALREADPDRRIRGFNLRIDSDVPLGAGLSSSAALEVAVLRALREAFGLDLDDVRLALFGQRAENEFVGAHCGIMDQMAASLADGGTALFLDTRSLAYRRVPLPAEAELVVIHSGVSHAISGGDYNARRAECEAAARMLGVAQLRDLTFDDLPRIEKLPEPLGRRARHVLTEDKRVLDAVDALEAGELVRLGELFDASHASMRDDFEVSVPEVDMLVGLAQADAEVLGARLTGGGFGGSVVILARHAQGAAVAARVAQRYSQMTRVTPQVLVPANP